MHLLYTNMPDDGFEGMAANSIEAFADRFRAVTGQARPPDLYHAVYLYRNIDVREGPSGVR